MHCHGDHAGTWWQSTTRARSTAFDEELGGITTLKEHREVFTKESGIEGVTLHFATNEVRAAATDDWAYREEVEVVTRGDLRDRQAFMEDSKEQEDVIHVRAVAWNVDDLMSALHQFTYLIGSDDTLSVVDALPHKGDNTVKETE